MVGYIVKYRLDKKFVFGSMGETLRDAP